MAITVEDLSRARDAVELAAVNARGHYSNLLRLRGTRSARPEAEVGRAYRAALDLQHALDVLDAVNRSREAVVGLLDHE